MRLHVTAVLLAFFTVAVNCCCAPVTTWTAFGDTVTETGGTTVIVAEADLVESATKVAVIETAGGLGTVEGAV
jgi:hypothetical protein